jgi:5-methylcytosine-specific restriction enzyme subunit McrC
MLVPAMTAHDANPSQLSRLNARYLPLLTLARLFLADASLQLTGGGAETFAFVLDMNRLFEGFVVEIVRQHRREILPEALQACALLLQSVGEATHLASRGTRPVFRLRPDLTVRCGTQFPLILDAKYKWLDADDARLGIPPADFYQMHAYARRYDCPRVVLIYPHPFGSAVTIATRFHLNPEPHGLVDVVGIDLRLDLGSTAGVRRLTDQFRSVICTGVADERPHGEDYGLAGIAPVVPSAESAHDS